jgi:predicted nucleotidyltransferase
MATARDLAVIAVKGNDYAVMTTWMLESLSMYSLDIEVVIVVHDETTMETLTKRLSLTAQSLVTQIHQVAVDVGTYPAWAWRWFAINNADINYSQWKNIFILDTDLLFLKDPKELFESYTADLWFHKITSLDIDKWKKFLIKREEIEGSNLGMITMLNYIDEFKSQTLPKYHVNGGCFRVPGNVAADIFKMLYVRIIALGPRKMKMTEAVLSMILAEKGLKIWSDQEDVKYYSERIRCKKSEFINRLPDYKTFLFGSAVSDGHLCILFGAIKFWATTILVFPILFFILLSKDP